MFFPDRFDTATEVGTCIPFCIDEHTGVNGGMQVRSFCVFCLGTQLGLNALYFSGRPQVVIAVSTFCGCLHAHSRCVFFMRLCSGCRTLLTGPTLTFSLCVCARVYAGSTGSRVFCFLLRAYGGPRLLLRWVPTRGPSRCVLLLRARLCWWHKRDYVTSTRLACVCVRRPHALLCDCALWRFRRVTRCVSSEKNKKVDTAVDSQSTPPSGPHRQIQGRSRFPRDRQQSRNMSSGQAQASQASAVTFDFLGLVFA
jgi:hypothetical protein